MPPHSSALRESGIQERSSLASLALARSLHSFQSPLAMSASGFDWEETMRKAQQFRAMLTQQPKDGEQDDGEEDESSSAASPVKQPPVASASSAQPHKGKADASRPRKRGRPAKPAAAPIAAPAAASTAKPCSKKGATVAAGKRRKAANAADAAASPPHSVTSWDDLDDAERHQVAQACTALVDQCLPWEWQWPPTTLPHHSWLHSPA